jgi:predicted MFS family arabinose efflux permease
MSEMRLGLRENLPQFSLLVVLNAFVGAMVGLERTVLPLLGEQEFGLSSKTAITSFIVSFGVTKAVINLLAARASDRIGRKPILVVGWLFALPVPFLIIYAPAWWWIDLANVLLGANQAMAWSMTVIMKVDLVGPKRRGLALGLNEFAGYFAVGVMSWVTGYIAAHSALRPQPFYLGIVIAVVGLVVSTLFARETRPYAHLEAATAPQTTSSVRPSTWRATSLGVYRFWRDLGYAVGALLSGVVADLVGLAAAIHLVAALTLISGLVVVRAMGKPSPRPIPARA